MTSPSDYAARLTRLQTLGAGEGVPEYIDPDDYEIRGVEFGQLDDRGWVRNDDCVTNSEAATRILESCLWETLRGWACPGSGWHVAWLDCISVFRILDGHTIAEECGLLEAADAAIAYLEGR
jgi:hypothetical protein